MHKQKCLEKSSHFERTKNVIAQETDFFLSLEENVILHGQASLNILELTTCHNLKYPKTFL